MKSFFFVFDIVTAYILIVWKGINYYKVILYDFKVKMW